MQRFRRARSFRESFSITPIAEETSRDIEHELLQDEVLPVVKQPRTLEHRPASPDHWSSMPSLVGSDEDWSSQGSSPLSPISLVDMDDDDDDYDFEETAMVRSFMALESPGHELVDVTACDLTMCRVLDLDDGAFDSMQSAYTEGMLPAVLDWFQQQCFIENLDQEHVSLPPPQVRWQGLAESQRLRRCHVEPRAAFEPRPPEFIWESPTSMGSMEAIYISVCPRLVSLIVFVYGIVAFVAVLVVSTLLCRY